MSDDIIEVLRRIGIRAAREALAAWLTHATKSRLGAIEIVEQLVALELRERDARNLARRMRGATLGPIAALDSFDWNHPRVIDRTLYELLLGLDFVARGENILFRGQSGVGKTMLAQNIALTAIQQGKTARFSTLATLLADLLRQESFPRLDDESNGTPRPTCSFWTSSATFLATVDPPIFSTTSSAAGMKGNPR
jgi:DNA replication protein DnaC